MLGAANQLPRPRSKLLPMELPCALVHWKPSLVLSSFARICDLDSARLRMTCWSASSNPSTSILRHPWSSSSSGAYRTNQPKETEEATPSTATRWHRQNLCHTLWSAGYMDSILCGHGRRTTTISTSTAWGLDSGLETCARSTGECLCPGTPDIGWSWTGFPTSFLWQGHRSRSSPRRTMPLCTSGLCTRSFCCSMEVDVVRPRSAHAQRRPISTGIQGQRTHYCLQFLSLLVDFQPFWQSTTSHAQKFSSNCLWSVLAVAAIGWTTSDACHIRSTSCPSFSETSQRPWSFLCCDLSGLKGGILQNFSATLYVWELHWWFTGEAHAQVEHASRCSPSFCMQYYKSQVHLNKLDYPPSIVTVWVRSMRKLTFGCALKQM